MVLGLFIRIDRFCEGCFFLLVSLLFYRYIGRRFQQFFVVLADFFCLEKCSLMWFCRCRELLEYEKIPYTGTFLSWVLGHRTLRVMDCVILLLRRLLFSMLSRGLGGIGYMPGCLVSLGVISLQEVVLRFVHGDTFLVRTSGCMGQMVTALRCLSIRIRRLGFPRMPLLPLPDSLESVGRHGLLPGVYHLVLVRMLYFSSIRCLCFIPGIQTLLSFRQIGLVQVSLLRCCIWRSVLVLCGSVLWCLCKVLLGSLFCG